MQTERKYVITFIIDGLGMGGAERLMIPILKNLSREIFLPRVCVLQNKEGNPIAEDINALGVPVDFLEVKYLRDISALPRLIKYLKDTKTDLVHTQLEFANILGNLSAKFLRLPSVCTIHTMPSQEMSLKSKTHQEVELFSLHFFCDRVISVSQEAREYHLKLSKVSPDNVNTIYNGIDLTHYLGIDRSRERLNLRDQLGISRDSILITTVAVLRPQKGIQYMIRAMPSILARHSNVYYLIVGSGSHENELMEEDKLDFKDHVIFTGMRKDVPAILSASDIFVLPTLTEALPTVLAEAMAARLPIIASAVGGIPEMVVNGENGYLVSPGDPAELAKSCHLLLDDPDKREAFGNNGWKIVNEKFNIQRQVEQLKDLYLDLVRHYGK